MNEVNNQEQNYSGEVREVGDEEIEAIHTTNPENEFDEFEEPARQNFQTGTPVDEDELERTSNKKKSGMAVTIAVTLGAALLLLVVVVFFIMRGKSSPQETVVKDNSAKMSVNSNVSTAGTVPNFEQDYREKYDANANIDPMGNNASSQTIAGVNPAYPMNITAPPQPNYDSGIYQPTQQQAMTSNSNTQPQTSIANGGGGGGRTENTVTRTKSNSEIVELPNNDQEVAYRNVSGGRNDQSSLFFFDRNENQNGNLSRIEIDRATPVKPNFGTVLPIRVLGRLHTLGTNGLARMELTRTVQGSWGTIPRGTLFVGRVSGGEGNRVFVSLIGYIDSRSNRLVTIGGDLQGTDGALGMQGDVKRLGSRWSKVFGEILSSAKEIGSAYLLGRRGGAGTVINNGQLERIPNALEGKDTTRYTVVPAGANGYVVINDLPPAIESDERLATTPIKPLTDEELLRMIQTNTSSEIEQMMPNLSANGQLIARRALENK